MISCWRRGKLRQVGGGRGRQLACPKAMLEVPAPSSKTKRHTGVYIKYVLQIHICPHFETRLTDSLLLKSFQIVKRKLSLRISTRSEGRPVSIKGFNNEGRA